MQRRPWHLNGAPAPEGEGGGQGGGGGTTERTFTQDRVNELTTAEHAKGERKAAREAAEKLGMTPDEAAAELKRLRDLEASTKSDRERADADAAVARTAAEADRAVAAKEKADAQAERRAAKIERTLVQQGVVDAENLTDAVALLGSVPADADDAAVTTAVDALKTRRPELFKAGPAKPAGAAPSTVVGAPAGGTGNNGGAATRPIDKGRENARRILGVSAPDKSKANV